MALKLSKGQWAILAMFGAVAIYVGALMLMVEPTIWRDVPEEGMSRNGVAFDEAIAEVRLYRMPHREFPFYFEDELAPVEPDARTADPEAIRRILAALENTGDSGWCQRRKIDAWLHVVALRADGSVFGYVILAAAKRTGKAPADLPGCGVLIIDDADPGVKITEIYGAFAALKEITGVQF